MSDQAREEALAQAALVALRGGNAAKARATLAQMAAPPPMLLAQVCNRLGDRDGEAEGEKLRVLTEKGRTLLA